jgi:ATP adenylyltransferase
VTGRPALWAPWRGEYVEGPKGDGCILCEPKDPTPDRERLIVFRGAHAFVLLNRYPYTPGHLMVAPYTHVARLPDLTLEAQQDLIRCVTISQQVLEDAYQPDGLNMGANFGAAAGAGVADHLHVHLVPRWAGDTNFMTVLGEVRVIPKHLDQIYDNLAPRFAEADRT